ncbi:MAG TPA: AAA family ATPase [Bryobacteraceae bacterium]|jgi:type II secretory pathway predicted ATPase ExeA
MYHAHFGFREEPFGATPDRRFFFETAQHREAAATLSYAIQQRRGFALLVGRPGLGKTSVLMRVVQLLEGKAEVAYLPYPYFDRSNVLESILMSLGIEPAAAPAQNHRLFYEYLQEKHRAGKTCVVIFDEAQDLNRDTLEAIRMLSNFETMAEKLVQIVLAGQPGLTGTLNRPDCEQIRQRMNVVARLQKLSPEEVRDYMAHRLETVGASLSVFSREALEQIANASDGVPRNINTLCFNSLSVAYALNHRQVACEEVAEARRDLDLTPLDLTLDVVVKTPAVPPSVQSPDYTPAFKQARRSFRSVCIAGGVAVSAAALLFQTLFAQPVDTIPTTSAISRAPVVPAPAGVPPAEFSLQVGAFRNRENAERLRSEMESRYGAARIVQRPEGSGLWRVLLSSKVMKQGSCGQIQESGEHALSVDQAPFEGSRQDGPDVSCQIGSIHE